MEGVAEKARMDSGESNAPSEALATPREVQGKRTGIRGGMAGVCVVVRLCGAASVVSVAARIFLPRR
jgi:hypothetical protein